MSNGYLGLAQAFQVDPCAYMDAINGLNTTGATLEGFTNQEKHLIVGAVTGLVGGGADMLIQFPVFKLTVAPVVRTLNDIHHNGEPLWQAFLSSGYGGMLGAVAATKLAPYIAANLPEVLMALGVAGETATAAAAAAPLLAAAAGVCIAAGFNKIVDTLAGEEDFLGKKAGDMLYDFLHAGGDKSIASLVSNFFNRAQGFVPNRDPLALDLDGDGLETVGTTAGVLFDHDASGVRKNTGWIKADDGLLVFDRNNDGVINNGRELFGDNTLKYDGSGTCADAFEALAQEDTNGDGVVNHLDDNWGSLKVWRDLNQDGISQAEELFTLEELGITSLNLDKKAANQNVAGGVLVSQGSYTKEDGSTGLTGQFDFSNNPF